MPDLVHDVFLRAFEGVANLGQARALKAWLTSIAVFTARGCIRRRARRRWLMFFAPEDLPEIPAAPTDDDSVHALRATYRVMAKLPVDERTAFALRVIDGMELTEVAAACRVSLATAKRRVARAEARFLGFAAEYPVLRDWIAEGQRWSQR